jgi:cysteine desulfurase
MEALDAAFANPSARHRAGYTARRVLDNSRQVIAEAVGVPPDFVHFGASATELLNLVIRSRFASRPESRGIGVNTMEHAAVLETVRQLQASDVFSEVVAFDASEPMDKELALRLSHTSLVACMAANNETGIVFDVAGLAAATQQSRVPVLCDMSQAFGRVLIHPASLGVTAAVISGHKIGAPKGVAVLIAPPDFRDALIPTQLTGGGQEFGFRAGTENLPAIAAMAAAVKDISGRFDSVQARLRAHQHRFESIVLNELLDAHVVGGDGPRAPHISCLLLYNVDGELVQSRLRDTVCISTRSACHSGHAEPSHVLRALGYAADVADTAIRVSFGEQTTEQEVEDGARAVASMVKSLRSDLGL